MIDTAIRCRGLMTINSCVAELKDTMALDRRSHKAKTPAGLLQRGFHFKSLAVTYSCMAKDHTTIGAERFHFRVRKGIGWFPLAIAARQTGSRAQRSLRR